MASKCRVSGSLTKKWFPCNKGGGQRKWYGNQSEVIDWEHDGEAIKNYPGAVIRNEHCYYKESVAWNMISSGFLSFRYFPKGFILNNASNAITEGNLYAMLGYLSSPLTLKVANLINPTLNLSNGVVAKFPYVVVETKEYESLVKQNIFISKQDWDAHETSWDFETNPLLAVDTDTYIDNIHHEIERHEKETGERICIDPAAPELDSLEWRMEQYKQKWEHLFMQLHENEEELNRQFIDIYGLQDELTPDVPLDEITILQQGEISINFEGPYCGTLSWHNDVIAKQLISYAIGCWLGRYRLDKPGLHIAHPNPTAEEVCTYTYNGSELEIDDDGIIPILSADSQFADNACHRLRDFLRIAFGEENLLENINFIETCLGKSLEAYFIKDFWKDHKRCIKTARFIGCSHRRKAHSNASLICTAWTHTQWNVCVANTCCRTWIGSHIASTSCVPTMPCSPQHSAKPPSYWRKNSPSAANITNACTTLPTNRFLSTSTTVWW